MVIFDALVREQGISAAARRLGVSKSHISKQLALLETALGAQLVQRTTRRFGLTELGQEYARHCRALVAVALEAESLVGQRLADIGFVLVASPDYLLSHGTPLHPRDLAHHNCITYQSRERRYHEWSFRQGKERQTVQVAGNYRVDLAEAVRDAALAGLGIAYVANYLLDKELQSGQLI
ncbi:LysR family transcriptional regulator, partial [Aeromonas caviae]|uniref:LysR family transcriptional regulator n=1 Tax=Aeromonas caviae TaxID=648 RepID=UPI001FB865EE